MPTYSYHCEKCGKKFERTETMSEHEAAQTKCAHAFSGFHCSEYALGSNEAF